MTKKSSPYKKSERDIKKIFFFLMSYFSLTVSDRKYNFFLKCESLIYSVFPNKENIHKDVLRGITYLGLEIWELPYILGKGGRLICCWLFHGLKFRVSFS